MMRSPWITGLVLGSIALTPSLALAYTSPEQVISQDPQGGRFLPPPPADPQQAVADQQQKSADRRAQEQSSVIGNGQVSSDGSVGAGVSSDATMHPAAGVDPAFVQLLQQVNDKLNADAAAKQKAAEEQAALDARILQRVQQHQADLAAQDALGTVQSQESLHSGAPLAGSGMGTSVAALLMMLAMGGVVAWVVRLEKK